MTTIRDPHSTFSEDLANNSEEEMDRYVSAVEMTFCHSSEEDKKDSESSDDDKE